MCRLTNNLFALTVVALGALIAPARADNFNIAASERGWVCTPSSTCGGSTNNGTSSSNNYLAGFELVTGQFRDWFEFSVPTLTGGSLVSATLQLDEPGGAVIGHQGGAFTYAVYGLSGRPLIFTDVTTSNPFGSVGTSTVSNGTTVTITMNAVALAAISADQGGNIFIGGIDSGELNTTSTGIDFSGTDNPAYHTVLSLQTTPAAVPEPSSLALLAGVLGAVVWRVGRKRPLA